MNPITSSKVAVYAMVAVLVMASASTALSSVVRPAHATVGDVIAEINLDSIIDPSVVYCSIGVAFDGTHLYVDACSSKDIQDNYWRSTC